MKFKQTNSLINYAFAIHIILVLIASLEGIKLLFIMLVPLLGNFAGLYFLKFTDKIKFGVKIFMISSVFFVPFGVIGVLGCKKVLNGSSENDFLKTDKKIKPSTKDNIITLIVVNIILILGVNQNNILLVIPIMFIVNFITIIYNFRQKDNMLGIIASILFFISPIIVLTVTSLSNVSFGV